MSHLDLDYCEEAEEATEATEATDFILKPEPLPPAPVSLIRSFSQEELALPELLASFRELLKNDEVVLRRDDEFLVRFLRVKRYNVARAHTALVHYYHVIRKNQDILLNVRPSEFGAIYAENMGVVLRGRGRDGSIIGYFRPGLWDTRKFSLQQVVQAALFLAEQAMQDKNTQLYGLTTILDLQHLSPKHLTQVTSRELQRAIFLMRSELPAKMAGAHILNHPRIIWPLFKVFMRILPKKLRRRVYLHSDLASLHKSEQLDVATLPNCIGGPLELQDSIDHTVIQKLLEDNRLCAEYYT